MIYAEAAHWAAGEYALDHRPPSPATSTTTATSRSSSTTTGCSRVFEGNGGRLTHLFVKGPGYGDTAIGVRQRLLVGHRRRLQRRQPCGGLQRRLARPPARGLRPAGRPGPSGPTVSLRAIRNEVSKEISADRGRHLPGGGLPRGAGHALDPQPGSPLRWSIWSGTRKWSGSGSPTRPTWASATPGHGDRRGLGAGLRRRSAPGRIRRHPDEGRRDQGQRASSSAAVRRPDLRARRRRRYRRTARAGGRPADDHRSGRWRRTTIRPPTAWS